MKLILSLLALTALSFATPARAEDGFPSAKPIRFAKMKAEVRKGFLAYDDMLNHNWKSICQLEGEIPVYAPADSAKIARLYGNFHCDGIQNGRKVRVQVSGAIYFDDAKGDVPAKKSLVAVVFVNDLTDLEWYSSQGSYAATTDLNTKNLELNVNSATYEVGTVKQGSPAYTVVINATDEK